MSSAPRDVAVRLKVLEWILSRHSRRRGREFTEATDLSDSAGRVALYWKAQFIEPDSVRPIYLKAYERICLPEDDVVNAYLEHAFEDVDNGRILTLVNRAADKREVRALFMLGEAREHGFYGLERNLLLARQFYQAAAPRHRRAAEAFHRLLHASSSLEKTIVVVTPSPRPL